MGCLDDAFGNVAVFENVLADFGVVFEDWVFGGVVGGGGGALVGGFWACGALGGFGFAHCESWVVVGRSVGQSGLCRFVKMVKEVSVCPAIKLCDDFFGGAGCLVWRCVADMRLGCISSSPLIRLHC